MGGEVVLENQNGGIDASAIGGSVKASTSFSSLKVSAKGPAFDCHNQNGEIYIQATSPALASIQAETSFGGLEVRIPAALKPVIVAKTSFGEVDSDFPFNTQAQQQSGERGIGAGRASNPAGKSKWRDSDCGAELSGKVASQED